MPSDREIEAAAQALIKLDYPKGDHYERTAFDDTHVYRREAKAALEAAEQARWLPISEPQDGDIGIDEAERLYKFLFNKWVAQGKSSEPVHPVKIIARRINGEFLPTPPEENE